MSSKAEKTSHYSHKQPQLNIFFRNPLLLKIVAWLGSLSVLSSTGLVWADIQPISTPRTDAPELIQASGSKSADPNAATSEDREIYGPHLPITQSVTPVPANPAQLLSREVPIAVAPASATILPTGTIVRPQHTDILTAKNYTVGINQSTSAQQVDQELVSIPAPASLRNLISSRTREVANMTSSQIQHSDAKSQSVISQAAPTTSLKANSYRPVPVVASLPHADRILQHVGRSGVSTPTPVAIETRSQPGTQRRQYYPQVVPLAGLKPTVVTPMKPSVAAQRSIAPSAIKSTATLVTTPVQLEDSIEISVPVPRSQKMPVQNVAQLPQFTGLKVVPTVPAIPTVRPAASPSAPIAFANTGANESATALGYPLASPAPETSSFGWRTHPITGSRRFHSGIDIGAPMGAPVVAAGSGMIVSSGWLGGYGKAIVIQHNGIQQTLYGHLSEVFVQPGQRIEQGTVIGRVGSTGRSTGPHLHFESQMATADGWVAVDPGEGLRYALANLQRSAPFAQRDLPPGYN